MRLGVVLQVKHINTARVCAPVFREVHVRHTNRLLLLLLLLSSVLSRSPIKEVIFGVRAISPLVVALILLVACVLRQPLPDKGFVVDDADWEESEEGEEEESDNTIEPEDEAAAAAGYERQQQQRGSSSNGSEGELGRDSGSTSTAAAAALVTTKDVELGAVQVGTFCGNAENINQFSVTRSSVLCVDPVMLWDDWYYIRW
jgi:hypothetical protein